MLLFSTGPVGWLGSAGAACIGLEAASVDLADSVDWDPHPLKVKIAMSKQIPTLILIFNVFLHANVFSRVPLPEIHSSISSCANCFPSLRRRDSEARRGLADSLAQAMQSSRRGKPADKNNSGLEPARSDAGKIVVL